MKISSQQAFVSQVPFEVSIFVPSQEQWKIVPPENSNILVTPIAGTGSMEVKVKVVGTSPARQQYITFSDDKGAQTFCLVFADDLVVPPVVVNPYSVGQLDPLGIGVIIKSDPTDETHYWVYSKQAPTGNGRLKWSLALDTDNTDEEPFLAGSTSQEQTQSFFKSAKFIASPTQYPVMNWINGLGAGWYMGSFAEWAAAWANLCTAAGVSGFDTTPFDELMDSLEAKGCPTIDQGTSNPQQSISQVSTAGIPPQYYFRGSDINDGIGFGGSRVLHNTKSVEFPTRAMAEVKNGAIVAPPPVTPPVDPYSIGQLDPEGSRGVIWKVDPLNKRHYWIYSKTQSDPIKWCASATLTVPDLNSSTTDGRANTKTVAAIAGRPAVEWVTSTLGDGWYVGASAEWKELWLNLTGNPFDSLGPLDKFDDIMTAMAAHGIPTLDASTAFWCSDEVLVAPNYSERVSALSEYRNGSSSQSAIKTTTQITLGFAEVEAGFVVVPQPDIEL